MHNNSVSSHSLAPYLLIAFLVLISWGAVLNVSFINDDYQILGFHEGKDLVSIVSPFWKQDISGVYWRPLGNLLHPLTLMSAGYNPLVFRLVSLLFYILCCITLYRLMIKTGIPRNGSLIAAMLFAIMPSHELQIAWIADQGEMLVAVCLMISFGLYIDYEDTGSKRKAIGAVFLFICALLIKEVAFTGILLPIVYLFLKGKYDRAAILKALKHIFIGLLVLISVLLYRFIVVGGTPFASDHFEHGGIIKYFINFLVYIPLAFFPPEALDAALYFAIKYKILAALLVFLIIVITVLVLRNVEVRRKLLSGSSIAGFVWFIIFIIPAVPNLMRWYVFTASIGLFWPLGVMAGNITLDRRKYLIGFTAIVCLLLSVYNSSIMLRWGENSRKTNDALASLTEIKNAIEGDTIFVWSVPDKFKRVPAMKLGVTESFRHATGLDSLIVISPLRAEFLDNDGKILLGSKGRGLKFIITKGRFAVQGARSLYIVENESYNETMDGAVLHIENREEGKNSEAAVLNYQELKNRQHYYFNGTRFIRIAN